MTAPSLPSSATNHHSRLKFQRQSGKSPAENRAGAHMTEADALSDLVVRALWASFPGEHSNDGLSAAAAPYFRNRFGEPISPRTVKYWLEGQSLPSALHLSTLVMMQPKLFLSHWLGRGA